MTTTDLHIHTAYCDGRDTPREIARSALERGFSSIGFSGHSCTPFDPDCCMSEADTEKYRADVEKLKRDYAGRMDIFLGLEQDYYSAPPSGKYDYIIGSVHYILKDGEYFPIDLDAETLDSLVKKHFGGDFDAATEEYFALVSNVVEKTGCDIIGHLDLISKFFEKTGYIPSKRYISAAKNAVRALVRYNRPFEINVGAMTRGYRTAPYPSEELLREIAENGGSIVISGDCHDMRHLGRGLNTAADFAKSCGFDRCMLLTARGWEFEKL